MTSFHSAAAATIADGASSPARSQRRVLPRLGRMSRERSMDVVAALDLAAVTACGVLPAFVLAAPEAGTGDLRQVVQASLVGAILTVICLSSRKIYDASLTHAFPVRAKDILTNLTIGILPLSGLAGAGLSGSLGLLWQVQWLAASFVCLLAGHALARAVLARLTARGYFDRRVAVFGAGVIARRLFDHAGNKSYGIRFAGLYDDRNDGRVDPLGLTILGRLEECVAAAKQGRFDQVVIALPAAADQRIALIAAKFDAAPVSVHVVTHLATDFIDGPRSLDVSHIGPVGLLDLKAA
jgi:FlaA1/EpsC-like NDP-sugar epimerase